MKIIQGLKKIKELMRKADDLDSKVNQHCADYDIQESLYPDQKSQISQWIQSHSDLLKEVLSLRISIQKTNLETSVTMELDGKMVTKSIAEWVHRRRDLAKKEESMWRGLTTKNLQEVGVIRKDGAEKDVVVKRRVYFDPKERDEKIEYYRSEPATIDATLETVNAVTDLM